jgi:hypothetical protein
VIGLAISLAAFAAAAGLVWTRWGREKGLNIVDWILVSPAAAEVAKGFAGEFCPLCLLGRRKVNLTLLISQARDAEGPVLLVLPGEWHVCQDAPSCVHPPE